MISKPSSGPLRPCVLACVAICLTAIASHAERATPYNLHPGYAQTAWPAAHRDSANSDYVPLVMSRHNRVAKHLIPGHPLFWPPLSGPNGQLYVTSGKGRGHSNLHAFDSRGELLWKSKPQQSLDDLDGFAILNAPTVARDGRIFVGDQNQLWAFRPDGEVDWVVDLARYGIEWGFVTTVISRQGYVGGISTNGKVLFFRSESGELAMPVLDLPGGAGPPAADTPFASLWRGLLDPEIKPFVFNLVQGWEMEVANTPAVHPESGRIYITAAGREPETGLLIGIDVFDDRLEIAFEAAMGGGSGTSPAISHDGRHVYALDEAGHMIAIDADSGERLWQTAEGGGGAASPTVGPDGLVYTPFQSQLQAFRPDGTRAWQYDYDALCRDQIPTLDGIWSWVFSEPVAFIDSIFTAAEREGWLNIVCGYHITFLPSSSERTLVPVPQKSLIVAIDLESGAPLGVPLSIPETSEGFISPTLDGNTFVSLSGAITSIFYHMLNPFLPAHLEVPDEPRAGLLLLEPVSRAALARQGVAWIRSRNRAALEYIEGGNFEAARRALRRGSLQRASSRAVIERAAADRELDPATAKNQLWLLGVAHTAQLGVLDVLELRQPIPPDFVETLQRALRQSEDALSKLESSLVSP